MSTDEQDDLPARVEILMGYGRAAHVLCDFDSARSYYRQAMDLMRPAAEAEQTEPRRARMLRVAAWLAFRINDHAEAVRLALLGLEGPDLDFEVTMALEDIHNAAHSAMSEPTITPETTP